MVEYNTAAVAGINRWIWDEIQTELGWTTINGRRPISIQQEPEMVNSGQPFITFAWSQDMQTSMVELKRERAVYCVFSKNVSDVVEAVAVMADLLCRWDWSAQDANIFISGNGTTDEKKYDYKDIHVASITGVEPPDEEGGYYEGTITISYTFTVPMASTTSQASGFGRMSA